jgi:hypothetical protein
MGPRGSRVDLVSTNSEPSKRRAHKNNAEVYFFGSKNIEGPEDETRIEELQSDEAMAYSVFSFVASGANNRGTLLR